MSNPIDPTQNIKQLVADVRSATEAIAGGELVTEAPSDGKQYARKNGAWVEVTGGGGGGNSYFPSGW